MSWAVLPWVYPVWDPLGFFGLGGYFFPLLGKFWTITSSNIFPCPFFLSSSSGTPMISMLEHLTLSQRSLRLSSLLVILFSSLLNLFPPFYFLPHYPIFCLSYSTFASPQSAFDLSYCIIHYWLTLLYFF